MITVSEERYVPVNPGYIVLQDREGLYYYVHRTFYEQAVVMQDRYGESIDTLKKLIGGNSELSCIEVFVESAPVPLSIMGYFLALLSDDVEEYVDIVGALDIIASAINLRNLIKQPEAIRQNVRFSMSVTNEYADGWQLFFGQCYPYNWMRSVLDGGRVAPPSAPSVSTMSYSTSSQAYEEEDEDDGWGDLMDDIEAAAAEETEKANAADTAPVAPTPVQPAPSLDGGSGLNVIRNRRRR